MAEPIRVLHFADAHIGMENYGKTDPGTGLSSRVVDFLRRIDEMVEYAAAHDVDLVIFAGDAFKTRSPNPTFQREFAHRVRDLSALASVVLLVGNHDLPVTALKASSIEIYDTLAVPNVWVAHDYEVRLIETKRGSALVGTAPYPVRARLMQEENTAGLTIEEIDEKLRQTLSEVLEQLAREADERAVDPATPRLLTGHFSVGGAVWGSERQVMLGRDVHIPLTALADDRWDYVALGHIHKHQNLTDGRADVPPVVYSGSLERIDFGEEGDPKGFCWIELARDRTKWYFEEVNCRPFFTIRCDCRKSLNPTQSVLQLIKEHRLDGAIVRLIIHFTPETEANFNENAIYEALRRAGVFQIAGMRKEIERSARARLGVSPEGLTHEELLEKYFVSKEISAEWREELMDAGSKIIYAEDS